tara:strand:+ start:3714 stop:4163 length:450 start_codon:yes stop_codon:yes gene_type:complete
MAKLKKYNVKTVFKEGPRSHTHAGDHEFILDQPKQFGGSGLGPTPIDAFLASIGACLGTVARIVAKQEALRIEHMEFLVSGEIDLDKLAGRNTDVRAGFKNIKVNFKIDSPDLNDEEKLAFVKRVDSRCPVSDTINNGSKLDFSSNPNT